MASDLTSFLIGIAILSLIIERFVEKTLGKKEVPGHIQTIAVLIIGWGIAYLGSILVLKELFEKNVPQVADSFVTGLFIAAGADPIHQVIRWTEEKKEIAKIQRANGEKKRVDKKPGGRSNEKSR